MLIFNRTILEQETITKPEQSLITTLIPDLFSSEKVAQSKLIFTMFAGGTSQKFLPILLACLSIDEAVEVDWQARNSTCLSLDSWGIWWIALATWLSWTWFLWVQIDHVVIAKSSALFRSTIIQDNSSLKLRKWTCLLQDHNLGLA